MKALILDPAVHSMGGHHYNAVQRLQAELRKLGHDAPCLGSAYADDKVRKELSCRPVFTKSVYGRAYATAGEFGESVAETAEQLSQAMRRHRRPDLIILPCCDQVLASALAQYLKHARLARSPHILLWLLYGPHHSKAADDPAAAGLHDECRDAFTALAASVDDRRKIGVYCETPSLADFYRRLTGFDVGVLSGPGLVGRARTEAASSGPSTRGRSPTVACIGFANRSKGYRLLPAAIEHVLAHHRDVRFMIHGVVKGSDAEADQPAFDRLARLGERVMVRQDVLTPEAYLAWLAQADMLLLPYDPNAYRSRGSGVFSDARRIGIPVVAPGGCAFAQPAFDGGWGVAIGDYSSDGLGQAILAALGRLGELSTSAAASAGQADDGLAAVLRAAIVESQGARRWHFTEILGRFSPSA
jgi:glycosyltransferase involved in cell wall biosynthesis